MCNATMKTLQTYAMNSSWYYLESSGWISTKYGIHPQLVGLNMHYCSGYAFEDPFELCLHLAKVILH